MNSLIKSILLQPKVKTDSARNVEWEIQLSEIKTLLFIADPVFHVVIIEMTMYSQDTLAFGKYI